MKTVISGFLGVGGLLLLLIVLVGFKTIDSGEVGVVKNFGAVTGQTLSPGAHFVNELVQDVEYVNTKFVIYETMRKDDLKGSQSDYKDGAVDTNTKDGQSVDIYYTIRFSIDPLKATWVVQKFGSEKALVDKIVRAESRSVARTVPSNFSADELYVGSGKERVGQLIFENLKSVFENNGIVLDSVLVRELAFNEAYTSAIENKQIEAVKVQTAKNIADRAEFEKQTSIKQAEAQAETQRLQSQTISEQYLKSEWIKRWNGQLPTYMTGENSSLLMNIK